MDDAPSIQDNHAFYYFIKKYIPTPKRNHYQVGGFFMLISFENSVSKAVKMAVSFYFMKINKKFYFFPKSVIFFYSEWLLL